MWSDGLAIEFLQNTGTKEATEKSCFGVTHTIAIFSIVKSTGGVD